jgi:LAO/AO transport system kinase
MVAARPHDLHFNNCAMLDDILKGDFRAIARLITIVENESPEAIGHLRALFPFTGRAFTVGITGAPGAGKSTLVDKLAGHYRGRDLRVGIVAVDPTSPFTGGAILGDRIRMQSRSVDPGTFIRSMATRGNLGGLARTTADALTVLDAAGFDVILAETVGVGQDEVEIARTAETTLVLLVPGMGDDIQAMKAGIMEIGDVFVINKADHAGVERVEAELNALISISHRPDGWKPPVVKTVASDGIGIEACAQAVDAFRGFQKNSSARRERQLQVQKERLLELLRSQITRELLQDPESAALLEALAARVVDRAQDPYSAVEDLMRHSPACARTRRAARE